MKFLLSMQNCKGVIKTIKYEGCIEATKHYLFFFLNCMHTIELCTMLVLYFLASAYENSIHIFSCRLYC